MGVVWAAHHLALDTEVAVKLIRPERAADRRFIARFRREARATARIADPNVVKIMDYGTVDATVPYIVMELLRGFSLAELLEQGGRLSFSTARALLEQVSGALASAHQLGIVHRDIKPQNLFITEGSRDTPLFVKVLDFGVAKMLDSDQGHATHSTLTEAGVVMGSASYMSPEQLEASHHVDFRSDLWSVAVIMYEALTGSLPFRGTSFVTIGAAVLRGEYTPPSRSRPGLPEGIDPWFAKALSLDPGRRFVSAREMLRAFPSPPDLEAIARGLFVQPHARAELAALDRSVHVSATLEHPPAAPRPQRNPALGRGARRLGLLLGAAGVLASLVAATSWHWARSATAIDCPHGMVLIRGATFRLGSLPDAEIPSDETTVGARADVTLPSFCIDITEVTVGAYESCKSCPRAPVTVEFEGLTPRGRDVESRFCNRETTPNHPMNCVDWFAAQAFCVSQGKRLPTEAQWELAARGPAGRTYPWGEAEPSGKHLNVCDTECSAMLTKRLYNAGRSDWPVMFDEKDRASSTAAVGQYPAGATPEGVLDLAGNVWEWTDSRYCPYPYDPADGCGDSRRVLRGGGWDTTEAQNVRAARRYPSVPTARGRSVGFRCVRAL